MNMVDFNNIKITRLILPDTDVIDCSKPASNIKITKLILPEFTSNLFKKKKKFLLKNKFLLKIKKNENR